MHEHIDHFQGTTLTHGSQASVASVVGTRATLEPRGGMYSHSIMNASGEGDCLLTSFPFLNGDSILSHTVYTLGYRTPGAMEKVEELVQQGAMLLDIRMKPRSRSYWRWNRKQLQTRFGVQYYDHLELLGNVNYQFPDRPMQLQDTTNGILWLLVYLQRRDVIVLCGCPDPTRCHRSLVCALLHLLLPMLSIVHLFARTDSTGEWIEQRVGMIHLPEPHKPCPRCGFHKAILIMDFYGTVPQLDSLGYPHYHCPICANTFTALDLSPDTTTQQEADNGNQ